MVFILSYIFEHFRNYSIKNKKLINFDIQNYRSLIKEQLFNMVVSKHQCKNNSLFTYTGRELSPLGLGYCADAEPQGKEMIGRDGNIWVVKFTKGNKSWAKNVNKRLEHETPVINDIESYRNIDYNETSSESESNLDTESNEDNLMKKEQSKKNTAKPINDEDKPKKKGRPKKDTKKSINKEEISLISETNSVTVSNEDEKPKKKGGSKKNTTESSEKKERKPRAPTEYNKFISNTLKDLRTKHEGEGIKTTEFMKMAIVEWKKFKEESSKKL